VLPVVSPLCPVYYRDFPLVKVFPSVFSLFPRIENLPPLPLSVLFFFFLLNDQVYDVRLFPSWQESVGMCHYFGPTLVCVSGESIRVPAEQVRSFFRIPSWGG